jgi:hypothetical protein
MVNKYNTHIKNKENNFSPFYIISYKLGITSGPFNKGGSFHTSQDHL